MEKIYYALGELAYLVAASDGKVQQSEIDNLHRIVVEEIKSNNADFEYSDIIFNVLNAEKPNLDLVYNLAIKELHEASYYVTEEVKAEIIGVLKRIAQSYEHSTQQEMAVIHKVEDELKKIHLQ